jgi:hypothetical protein
VEKVNASPKKDSEMGETQRWGEGSGDLRNSKNFFDNLGVLR